MTLPVDHLTARLDQTVLSLRGVSKRFGAVEALRGADFTLQTGEIHALLGENGAGKSTLMHLACGLYRPDAGAMRLGAVAGFPESPRIARMRGLAMVHQHFTSVAALSVWENVALATKWPIREARERTASLLSALQISLDLDRPAGDLSVGLRQRLELAKALASEPTVLLLDEPTGALAPSEISDLFRALSDFTARGGAAVLITHKLDEALLEADRVTVLRRGQVTLDRRQSRGLSRVDLLVAMLGGPLDLTGTPTPVSGSGTGAIRIAVDGLTVERGNGRGHAVEGATFEVRGGELVAVAGVEGSGQRELLRVVAGISRPVAGDCRVAQPIGYIPEDRTTEALIPEFTLTENLALGAIHSMDGWRMGWRDLRRRMTELIARDHIGAPGPDARIEDLSGGNQQKVVIARALEADPAVIVAENPTRGLDLRAAAAVHARLRAAAAAGAAVLVHSTDLDEVVALGDRVYVMAGGRLTPVPRGADRSAVGAMMLAAPAQAHQ